MIDAGELGTVMMVEGNYSHDFLADVVAGNWRTDPAEAPAAGMTGMGIHLVDSYVHLLGPVDEVSVIVADRMLGRPSGDTVAVLLRFQSGATGYLGSTLVTSFLWRLQVMGSKGWAETRGEADLTLALRGQDIEERNFDPVDSVYAEWEAFLDAIDGTKPYPVAPDQMRATVATLEAIFESARTGGAVKVRGTA